MPSRVPALFALLLIPAIALLVAQTPSSTPPPAPVFGYSDFAAEQAKTDQTFLAVPDAKLAGEELKTLTAEPHIAASPEDYKTAQYVAEKFKAAGLDTSIVPYKAWLNMPKEVKVQAYDADGKLLMTGPVPEHVDGNEPFQNDPRVTPAFNGSSPSGDVTGEVVYANYGRPEDFKKLKDLGIDLKGKIVLVRYGGNFRGVKVYIAQQYGAAGVLIYSDPADDGYYRGDMYPKGPYRPATAVQRGSVQFMFKYPGDALTPGIASTPDLPAVEAPQARRRREPAQNSLRAALLSRCRAHPRASRRPRCSPRMAGRAALHLPRRPRRQSSPGPQNGLPVPHHLGRNRHRPRRRVSR